MDYGYESVIVFDMNHLIGTKTFGWSEVLGGAVFLAGVWIAQSDSLEVTEKVAAPDTPKGA